MDLQSLLALFVTSASLQEEPIHEAPGPVTVITDDMIRAIGARNLKEILTTYVPGFSAVEDHNELIFAARGIYASSQQKALIMVDGHRLNGRAYSMANPDFGIDISADKVKQIEVLRGPGSAVYGNVALVGVINIITKQGADIDGAKLRLGLGDFGQRTLHLTYGRQFAPGHSLVLWGSYYEAAGERYDIPLFQDFSTPPRGGSALVGAVRDPGSHDVGLRYEVGDFHLLAINRYGKHTEPFGAVGDTGDVYDYGQIRTFLGMGPGLGHRSNHLELGFDRQLTPRVELDVTAYYDTDEIYLHGVSGIAGTPPTPNNHSLTAFSERVIGGTAQLKTTYEAGRLGTGTLSVGGQAEDMNLVDSFWVGGADGEFSNVLDTKSALVVPAGHEPTYSAFAQIKHRLRANLIANVGGRYDYKIRAGGVYKAIARVSPRAALIYAPLSKLSFKLSYSESFVDAPYWYRFTALQAYIGSINLRPELLRSLQFTPFLSLLDGRFTNTLNVAWDHLADGIYRVPAAELAMTGMAYTNVGKLHSLSFEDEIAVRGRSYSIHANATYLHVLDVEGYTADVSSRRIWNQPSFFGNLIVDVRPLPRWWEGLWLSANLHYHGPQLSPIQGVSMERPDAAENLRHETEGYALLNVGFRAMDIAHTGLEVSFHAYNLLGLRYTQGGSPRYPYPQEGRWLLATVAYRLRP
jgi:outer membrane receptor for ferrienterochelin and colicins